MPTWLSTCAHMSNKYIGLDKQMLRFELKIVNIFLSINFTLVWGALQEPSHWDGSFEYPQHVLGWEIRK